MKSPFMIYTDLESILVPENNEMHSPDDSYTNKYQSALVAALAINWHILMINLASLLVIYRSNAVNKFITNMVEESKYCSLMKKHFN